MIFVDEDDETAGKEDDTMRCEESNEATCATSSNVADIVSIESLLCSCIELCDGEMSIASEFWQLLNRCFWQ